MWLGISVWGRGKGSSPSNTTCLFFFFFLHPRCSSLPTPSSTDWLISEGHSSRL